jgi:3'-phosphoadenosine 5'-phosphosulfate sulfotransferase (PAPS reductase)/FAD synthetase
MARHIVGLSGGKDSTAMALRLAEVEPRDYEFICTPTGNELPQMLAHWAKLEALLGTEAAMREDGACRVCRL